MQLVSAVVSYLLMPGLVILTLFCSSVATADGIEVPSKIIIELADSYCDHAVPNPRTTFSLSYECNYDSDEKPYTAYTLDLIPILVRDFDQDGIQDLAIEVRSLGPLGGSVTTNSAIHYLLLDQDGNVQDKHTVLLFAPFSIHNVAYRIDNDHIVYEAVPNFRAFPSHYDAQGTLANPKTKKVFKIHWDNNQPVSTFYQDSCQLATSALDEPFRQGFGVKTIRSIDMHNYIKTIKQHAHHADLNMSALLTGCDTRYLGFVVTGTSGARLPLLSEVLVTLKSVTNFSHLFDALISLEKNAQLVFGEVMPLNEDWNVQVHITRGAASTDMVINFREKQ